MPEKCVSFTSCETVCEKQRQNRDTALQLRAARELIITKSANVFGLVIDLETEAEVPPHILAAQAKDTDNVAALSQHTTALENEWTQGNAAIEAALDIACPTCPMRQLDLSPLPKQA